MNGFSKRDSKMDTLFYKDLKGRVISKAGSLGEELVFGKYLHRDFFLQFEDGVSVLFDSENPATASKLPIVHPPPTCALARINGLISGAKILDAVSTQCLASIALVLNNGCILVNQIGEFSNSLELLPGNYLDDVEDAQSIMGPGAG